MSYPYSLKRLRLALGMYRRTLASNFNQHNAGMRVELEKQLHSGQTALYGRRLSYSCLKQCGIPVACNRLFEIVRELDSTGIAERPFRLQKCRRGMFNVAGPNRVLSVDSHDKLTSYRIEIYAGIDTYSRYVIVSILQLSYYLDISCGFMLEFPQQQGLPYFDSIWIWLMKQTYYLLQFN